MTHPPLPPDPREWKASSMRLYAGPDGTMEGTAEIAGTDWHIRAWRKTASGRVEFQAQPVTDAEFQHIEAHLGRKVAG